MTNHERLIAESRARKFARYVKQMNLAFSIPNEWEKMTDEQIRHAIATLPEFGVKQRTFDLKWEPAQC